VNHTFKESNVENREKLKTLDIGPWKAFSASPQTSIHFQCDNAPVLTICHDGTIEIGTGYTPTEAADEFLKHLQYIAPMWVKQLKESAIKEYERERWMAVMKEGIDR